MLGVAELGATLVSVLRVLKSGGDVLEPINLEFLLDAPEDGMRLEVEYDLAENVFSICMVGPMVVLTSCEPVR